MSLPHTASNPCTMTNKHAGMTGDYPTDDDRKERGSERSKNEEMPTNSIRPVAPHLTTQMKWIEPLLYYLSGIGLALKCLQLLADNYLAQVNNTNAPNNNTPQNEPVYDSSSTQTKIHGRTNTTNINMESDNEPPLIDESDEDFCANKWSRCNPSPPTLPSNNNCHNQTAINSKGSAPPSPSSGLSDGAHLSSHRENLQQRTLYPAAVRFIRHGMEIVMLEAIVFGRKSLPWRVRYRNQDGLIISLLSWLWHRSWTTTYAIYIGTHVTSELLLWFNIGKRCAHTIGSDQIHPNIRLLSTDRKPHINPQHLSPAEEIQPQRVNTPGRRQTSFKEPYKGRGRTSLNKPYKLLASKILTASKGKRKAIDRPKRYRLWEALHNPILHNKSNFDTPMTGAAKGIRQHTIKSKLRERPMHHAISQGLRVQANQIVQHPPRTQPRNQHQPEQCNSLGRTKQRHRLSIMLKPTKQSKISTAEHSKPTLTAKDINTEPQYSLRCIIKCYRGALLWGNVYQHMIEGSGWVKPKRDVIKWFTFA